MLHEILKSWNFIAVVYLNYKYLFISTADHCKVKIILKLFRVYFYSFIEFNLNVKKKIKFKAEKLGTKIITEDEFLELIGTLPGKKSKYDVVQSKTPTKYTFIF